MNAIKKLLTELRARNYQCSEHCLTRLIGTGAVPLRDLFKIIAEESEFLVLPEGATGRKDGSKLVVPPLPRAIAAGLLSDCEQEAKAMLAA